MARKILLKPIISEKSEALSEDFNQYTFMVDKKADKLEIKRAVEDMFEVNVASVNTVVMPGKAKQRFTRNGVQNGRIPSFKKAIVTLVDGEEIDFFGDI